MIVQISIRLKQIRIQKGIGGTFHFEIGKFRTPLGVYFGKGGIKKFDEEVYFNTLQNTYREKSIVIIPLDVRENDPRYDDFGNDRMPFIIDHNEDPYFTSYERVVYARGGDAPKSIVISYLFRVVVEKIEEELQAGEKLYPSTIISTIGKKSLKLKVPRKVTVGALLNEFDPSNLANLYGIINLMFKGANTLLDTRDVKNDTVKDGFTDLFVRKIRKGKLLKYKESPLTGKQEIAQRPRTIPEDIKNLEKSLIEVNAFGMVDMYSGMKLLSEFLFDIPRPEVIDFDSIKRSFFIEFDKPEVDDVRRPLVIEVKNTISSRINTPGGGKQVAKVLINGKEANPGGDGSIKVRMPKDGKIEGMIIATGNYGKIDISVAFEDGRGIEYKVSDDFEIDGVSEQALRKLAGDKLRVMKGIINSVINDANLIIEGVLQIIGSILDALSAVPIAGIPFELLENIIGLSQGVGKSIVISLFSQDAFAAIEKIHQGNLKIAEAHPEAPGQPGSREFE